VDLDSSVDLRSYTSAACASESVCSVAQSVYNNQVTANLVDPGTDSCDIAESDNVVDHLLQKNRVNDISMDVEDQSSAVDPLLETTLEYSLCSDFQDSKMANMCEMQPTMEYDVGSTTEPVIDVDKNPVVDNRTDSSVTDDLPKPVDLLAISNNVNMDLRNSPTVRSPPTLMVV